MSFSDLEFAFFLPLALLTFWLVPRRAAAQNLFLLGASYLFYATWSLQLLPLLVASTLVDFFLARYIDTHRPANRSEDTPAVRSGRRRARLALAASMVWNLGLLCWFKYVGFFATALNEMLGLFGLASALPVLELALPVGISYYTLIKLGYVFDIYLGRAKASRNLLTFATFVAFFPQIVAGPIVRGRDLLPQYEKPRTVTATALRAAALLFLIGYVRKAYVSDVLALNLVNPIFAQPEGYSVLAHWAALLGFAGQVYCDFAGYSEMAIGCAAFFGVTLPVNFDRPFLSRSLFEFWRRWHITLNQWLFDYIYNLLTTSRGWFRGRLDIGLMLVFLASGLWHGAAWGFVIWGVLHGIGLVINRRWDVFYRGLCRKDRVWVKRRKTRTYALSAWALTQIFFVLTLLPFRVPGWEPLVKFTSGLLSSPGTALLEVPGLTTYFGLACCGLFLVGEHLFVFGPFRRLGAAFFRLPAPARGLAYGLVLVFLIAFLPPAGGAFIYARF